MVEFNDYDMENWVYIICKYYYYNKIFDNYSSTKTQCGNLLNFLDKLKVTVRFLR
jgi:hypothetical protein